MIRKGIKQGAVLLMMAVMGVVMVGARPVMADGVGEFAKGVCEDGSIDDDLKKQAGCEEDREFSNVAVDIINVVIGFIGLAAVVVIVFGGIQYTNSLGQPNKISQARSIIIYGVIGLVVAMFAWLIVGLIVNSISGAVK